MIIIDKKTMVRKRRMKSSQSGSEMDVKMPANYLAQALEAKVRGRSPWLLSHSNFA